MITYVNILFWIPNFNEIHGIHEEISEPWKYFQHNSNVIERNGIFLKYKYMSVQVKTVHNALHPRINTKKISMCIQFNSVVAAAVVVNISIQIT